MPTKFLESLGGKLAEKWLGAILTPAFIFWVGGLSIYISRYGWSSVENWFKQQSQPLQITLLIASLLLVLISAIIVNRCEFTVIRILEGYWISPLKWLRGFCCSFQERRKKKLNKRLQELFNENTRPLTLEENEEIIRLDISLHYFPVNQVMPTQLGNILRSAEERPQVYYGLDAFVCFPRLWLLLPDNVKNELTEARNTLNNGASLWLWSVLFILWGLIAWWAIPIGIISAYLSYQWILDSAIIYGKLLESAFDIYRFELYKALHFLLPISTQDEKEKGEKLTNYLWKRPLTAITFKHPD
ncbi:MAG: hypothetical protein AB4062_12240 [Crocosphaera sp.]